MGTWRIARVIVSGLMATGVSVPGTRLPCMRLCRAYNSLVDSIKAMGANGSHRGHLRSLSKSKVKLGAKGAALRMQVGACVSEWVGGVQPQVCLQASTVCCWQGTSTRKLYSQCKETRCEPQCAQSVESLHITPWLHTHRWCCDVASNPVRQV